MSTQESDGIDEALQGVTHVAMTSAARMGEQMARVREQQAREAQARSEQAAREQAARMSAERDAARSSLATVHRREWWDTAQGEDVAKAYQTATAWSDVDPEAVRAEQRIIQEVRNRFGVDVSRDGEANVAEAINRAERARGDASAQRGTANGDRAEAVALMAAADAHDELGPKIARAEARIQELAGHFSLSTSQAEDNRLSDALRTAEAERDSLVAERHRQGESAAEQVGHAELAYDSAERREEMAQELDHIENRAAVDARVRSDTAQGRPAIEATKDVPRKAPKARKNRSHTRAARTAQRTGQSR